MSKENVGTILPATNENITNFQNWFGNSKVRDVNKQPLVVYHGTSESFENFQTNPLEAKGFYGIGATAIGSCFSENYEIAASYPKSHSVPQRLVMNVYLSIENPKKYRTLNALANDILNYYEENKTSLVSDTGYHFKNTLANIDLFKRHLIEQGYDGITYLEGPVYNPTQDKKRVWVAFYPTQIKSVQNNGRFEPYNENIYS